MSKKNLLFCLFLVVNSLLTNAQALAASVYQGTVIAHSGALLDHYLPIYAVDQSGLSIGYTSGVTDWDAYVASGPTHESPAPYNCALSNTPLFVDLDFGQTLSFTDFGLWDDFESTQGVGDFRLQVADNPSFSGATLLGEFSAQHILHEPLLLQTFALSGATGRYVKLEILNRYGGYSGAVNYGEIIFGALEADCGVGEELVAEDWTMVGLPCTPDSPTVQGVWGDAGDLDPAQYGTRWVVFEWDTDNGTYTQLDLTDTVSQEKGYWIKSLDSVIWDVDGALTATVTDNENCGSAIGCFEVTLSPPPPPPQVGEFRWNLVGHPFLYAVDWSQVRVEVDGLFYPPNQAEARTYISKTVYKYENGSGYAAYDDVTPSNLGVLESSDGFWVKVLSGATGKSVKLLIPSMVPASGPVMNLSLQSNEVPELMTETDLPRSPRGESAKQIHKDPWYVRLLVETPSGDLRDGNGALGQIDGASIGYDRYDLPELAPFATPYLTTLFPHPYWNDQAGDYATDYHPFKKNKDSWVFEVRSDDPSRPLILRWAGPQQVLERSVLVDDATGTEIAATERSYEFDMMGESRTFRWDYVQRKKGGR